jgi:hypothetical protein
MKPSIVRVITGVKVALLLLFTAVIHPAQAQIFDVGCTTTALIAAIVTANGTPEADTLNLTPDCVYSFSAGYADTSNALPRITTPITIDGNGASISRVSGSPDFRLFDVDASGNLIVDNVTVSGGIAPFGIFGNGGGIRNLGTLKVTNSALTGNAANAGGGIYSENGTLTVTNSALTGNYAAAAGGGIHISGTLTVTNSIISGNFGGGIGGGAIFNANDSTATVTNSTLSGNIVVLYGGGIYNGIYATLTVTNSIVSANIAEQGGGIYNKGTLTASNSTLSGNNAALYGGGIFNEVSTVTVTHSTLSDNSAAYYGGGIYNANAGTAKVSRSTLSANSAASGGGIYNAMGVTTTVTHSILSGNSASNGGFGGAIVNAGVVTVTQSTLSGNSAPHGAGIHSLGGIATVTDSILSGNSAANFGGGISVVDGTLTVTSSTISGNSADPLGSGVGGGMFINGQYTTATVTNSIVWGNGAFDDSQVSGPATVTYSIVQGGGFAGDGNLDLNPAFADPKPFIDAPTTAGDYRLQADSPAIDAGSNAALPADTFDLDGDGDTAESLPYDLDSNPRVINAVVDMGAYEHQVAADVIVNKTAVNVTEGGATNSYTIHLAFPPAADVTIAVTTGGQTTVDPVLLTFTPSNWLAEQTVTVTAVQDAIAEGIHNDIITHTATSMDAAYDGFPVTSVAVSITDIDELLDNGGFEDNLHGWTVKNSTGDKRLCKLGKPYTGQCAYKFSGRIGEKAQLSQNVDLSGVTLNVGDTLTFSAFFKGNNLTAKTKLILVVTYAGNPTPVKSKMTVHQNAAYTQVALPAMTLSTGTITAVKVIFNHRSAAGNLFIDDVSLIHTPLAGRRSSDVLPPPEAPNGFRSSN